MKIKNQVTQNIGIFRLSKVLFIQFTVNTIYLSVNLKVVQKTIIDTLQGKPQKAIAEKAGCSQSGSSRNGQLLLHSKYQATAESETLSEAFFYQG